MKISDIGWVIVGLILLPIVFAYRCLQCFTYGFCEPYHRLTLDEDGDYLPYKICFMCGVITHMLCLAILIIAGAVAIIGLI